MKKRKRVRYGIVDVIIICMLIVAVSVIGTYVYNDVFSPYAKENQKLRNLALEKAAGEDGILQDEEIIDFLKDLNLKIPRQVLGLLEGTVKKKNICFSIERLGKGGGFVAGKVTTQQLGEYVYGSDYKVPWEKSK